jgi:hypothetical protein
MDDPEAAIFGTEGDLVLSVLGEQRGREAGLSVLVGKATLD